jgi:prolyl oligopeptidase
MRRSPPKTRVDDVVEVIHGLKVYDPYRWLEEIDTPETSQWIDAQNHYTESILHSLLGRDSIRDQLEKAVRVEAVSPPTVRAGKYFFFKRGDNHDHSAIYMRNGLRGEDVLLINPTALDERDSRWVNILDVSADGRIMACGARDGGEDECSVVFLDTELRNEVGHRLPKAIYSSISLEPDGAGVYYSVLREQGPRVCHRPIGGDELIDTEVFGKGCLRGQRIRAQLSSDGAYLLLSLLHGSSTNRIDLYAKSVKADEPLRVLVEEIDASFQGRVEDGYVYVRTDWRAPNGRVLKLNLSASSSKAWTELVPESDSVIIGMSLAGRRLFLNCLRGANAEIKMFDLSGRFLRALVKPSIGMADGMWGSWEGDDVFYTFSSLAQPPVVYRHSISTGKEDVWSDLDALAANEDVHVTQICYESKDGTSIPMFIAHNRGMLLDGWRPTLLVGYGGFGTSMRPGFSTRAAFWVENGGVFALPGVRGGGESGKTWHNEGVLEKKQNSIDDFISAAEWLIQNGYTNPAKLAIYGNSNGGLLIGAAMIQRPDLFKAAVCSHPLLDMVRYDRSLPARSWSLEYGNLERPEQFRLLYSYSPYHHVQQDVSYPAIFLVTGDADTRVSPFHALKMTAALQSTRAVDAVAMLRFSAGRGHSGGARVGQFIDDLTDEMTFLFWQLGHENFGASGQTVCN